MRIAYMTGTYPRATDTFIQREVAALRERGMEVHTFAVRRPGDEQIVGQEQQAERDRTFYILSAASPIALLLVHLGLLWQSPQRYWQAVQLAWSTSQPGWRGGVYQLFYFVEAGILAKQLHNQQIAHLHNHIADSAGTVAMLAAALAGLPFSFTLHGPYIFFEPYRWRLDEKIRRSQFVCCISHYCRSQAMIFAPMEKWQDLHIIHCGVDPDWFQPVVHQGRGYRLLFTGRLAAVKGLPILLESLTLLKSTIPDLVLTVVGDGSDRALLEQQVRQLQLEQTVQFVGYRSQAEVRDFMQQTDVFVLPSLAEGVPVVLMEAMATGVPVVATAIAGVSELVDHAVNGYLVPPGDGSSLANAIKTLLLDGALRSRFGQAGRLKVEQAFNLHHETTRLHHLFTAYLPALPDSHPEPTAANVLESV